MAGYRTTSRILEATINTKTMKSGAMPILANLASFLYEPFTTKAISFWMSKAINTKMVISAKALTRFPLVMDQYIAVVIVVVIFSPFEKI
jgi:hypothetical protein